MSVCLAFSLGCAFAHGREYNQEGIPVSSLSLDLGRGWEEIAGENPIASKEILTFRNVHPSIHLLNQYLLISYCMPGKGLCWAQNTINSSISRGMPLSTGERKLTCEHTD